MSRIKNPVEKKQLAYEDTVVFAEYPHAFRKNWPKKKAKSERKARHKYNQELKKNKDDETTPKVRRERVKKSGVSTVRERVKQNKERRVEMTGAHKARKIERKSIHEAEQSKVKNKAY